MANKVLESLSNAPLIVKAAKGEEKAVEGNPR
jgi:hypothetical protein